MNSFLSSLCVVVAAHLLFSGSYDASEVYHDACDFTDFNRYSLNASSGSSCCKFHTLYYTQLLTLFSSFLHIHARTQLFFVIFLNLLYFIKTDQLIFVYLLR